MEHLIDEIDPSLAGDAALAAFIAARPDALVAAIGNDARLVSLPRSLALGERQVFERGSGLNLFIADDQVLAIDAWRRAQDQPIVSVDLHLLADPDSISTLHLIDMRAHHGIHLCVLEVPDPARVLESIAAYEARPGLVAHVKRDPIAVFLEVDEATTALLGWSADQLIGRGTIDFVHPDDVDRAVEGWMSMRDGRGGRNKLRFRHADGRYVWLEVTNEDHLDDPELQCVTSELVDISQQMAELEALHERERLLHRLAEALPIGICHLRSDGQAVYSNAPLVDLLGPVESDDDLIGRIAEGDRERVAAALAQAFAGRAAALEVGVVRGLEERRCDLTVRTMADDLGEVDGLIVCAADVTERSRLRSELEHRASHDALSGCLNRSATVSALERALRGSRQVTVAYIDLDDFKSTNDELGHAAGDELLRVLAARLRTVTRLDDLIGRIGGDEFVVICPRDHGAFDPDSLVDRLSEAVCGDVTFAKRRIPLRASIGAAVSLDGELDAEALMGRADAAMYEAKRRNHGQRRTLAAVPRPATS